MTDSDSQQPQGDTTVPDPSGVDEAPQGEGTTAVAETPRPETDWKAEARKHEARAKKDAAALAELRKQLERMVSPETVADKETQLADTSAALASAQTEVMRWKIAATKGLPPDLAVRLIGSNEDEMAEDADRLAAMIAKPPKAEAARGGVTTEPNTTPSLTAAQLLKIATGKG